MNSYKRWMVWVFALSTLVFLVRPVFNYVIDPWGLNGRFRIAGVNTVKLDLHMRTRLHKAHVLPRLKPATIVLGISRAAQGIRTDHEAWDLKPVYNLSLDGGTIGEIGDFMEAAVETSPLKQVVIGLDFEAFSNLGWGRQARNETAEALAALGNPLRRVRPYFTTDMLAASLGSANRQRTEQMSVLPSGETSAPLFESVVAKIGGHRKLFLRSEDEYFNFHYSRDLQTNDGRSSLEAFRGIVMIARRHGIDLRLFISPVHARQMEVIRQLGLWSLFEQWKRELVAILAEDAATHLDKLPIPLWDFSGYNSLTTEHVPPAGDEKSRMRWYWESSHYHPALGDLVLDRIFNYKSPDRRVPKDFGVQINQANIESHLARIRREQDRYHITHPADVAEIESLFWQRSRVEVGVFNAPSARFRGLTDVMSFCLTGL